MSDEEIIRELLEIIQVYEDGHEPETADLIAIKMIAKARVCDETRKQILNWATNGSDQ